MHPRQQSRSAPVFHRILPAAALAALSLAGPSVASMPRTDPPATQTPPAAGPELPDLDVIEKQVSEIRGLKFTRDVPAQQQSLDDFSAYLDEEIAKSYPPEKVGGFEAGLLRLGMLLKPIDLGEEFKNALLTQAGGYYDPATGKFYYLMTDMSADFLKIIASHELVHALQDQHFKLGDISKKIDAEIATDVRNDDEVLALRFLVEGEATYVQTLWQSKETLGMDLHANPAAEQMAFQMQAKFSVEDLVELAKSEGLKAMGMDGGDIAKAMEAMDKIPPYILHPLLAAYMKGAYFVMSVRKAGGWDAVAQAYQTLPTTSEQVLHPDKFTGKRDEPTPVTLPDFGYLADGGWKPIDSAIHGEFYLSLLLRNFKCPAPKADRAAAGWDGDLYRAYRREDGRVAIVLATTWDTEKDAREFADAYRSILKNKYDLPAAIADQGDGQFANFVYQTGAADDDTGRVVQGGREVFIVEGVSPDLATRMIDDLKSTKIEHVD